MYGPEDTTPGSATVVSGGSEGGGEDAMAVAVDATATEGACCIVTYGNGVPTAVQARAAVRLKGVALRLTLPTAHTPSTLTHD